MVRGFAFPESPLVIRYSGVTIRLVIPPAVGLLITIPTILKFYGKKGRGSEYDACGLENIFYGEVLIVILIWCLGYKSSKQLVSVGWMKSKPKRCVAFFSSDSVRFSEGLTKDVELSVVLEDVIFAAHS